MITKKIILEYRNAKLEYRIRAKRQYEYVSGRFRSSANDIPATSHKRTDSLRRSVRHYLPAFVSRESPSWNRCSPRSSPSSVRSAFDSIGIYDRRRGNSRQRDWLLLPRVDSRAEITRTSHHSFFLYCEKISLLCGNVRNRELQGFLFGKQKITLRLLRIIKPVSNRGY